MKKKVFSITDSFSLPPLNLQKKSLNIPSIKSIFLSTLKRLSDVMNAVLMAAYMVIMLPIYLVVSEKKDDYEPRIKKKNLTDYLE